MRPALPVAAVGMVAYQPLFFSGVDRIGVEVGTLLTIGSAPVFVGAFESAHTRVPWRDLPSEFGKWNSAYRRFHRWSESGLFAKVLAALTIRQQLAAVRSGPISVAPSVVGLPRTAAVTSVCRQV